MLNFLNSNSIKSEFNLNDRNFIYNEGIDNFNFLKLKLKSLYLEKSFIVYRGFFFDKGAIGANLIFPSQTFFELALKYYNFKGNLMVTSKAISNYNIINNNDFFFF